MINAKWDWSMRETMSAKGQMWAALRGEGVSACPSKADLSGHSREVDHTLAVVTLSAHIGPSFVGRLRGCVMAGQIAAKESKSGVAAPEVDVPVESPLR